jgi:hypothetical protein
VSAIKVVIGTVPAMLREVLQQLLGDAPDIELLATPPQTLVSADEQNATPDVVVLATREDNDSECWRVLLTYPSSSVLAVSHGASNAALFQLHRHKEILGEASAEALLVAIRQAAAAA